MSIHKWTCRIHINTLHTAKFERYTGNEHITSYHFVFTVLYFHPYLMYHLYIRVNSLHQKYTRHCTSEIFFNAPILGVGSIANYSVLCADRFVFLASCWSKSLLSGCQSTSTKTLLKFFVKLHCSNNILMQPDRTCQESVNTVLFILGTSMSLLTVHYNHRLPIHINKTTSERLSRPSHLAMGTYLHISMHVH